MKEISSTTLSLLCELSSKYEGHLTVSDKGIKMELHCQRPDITVSKEILKKDMVSSRVLGGIHDERSMWKLQIQ